MMRDWLLLGARLLAPVVLYAFLGRLLYRMWVAARRAERGVARLRRLDDPAVVWTLPARATLGRAPANTIVLPEDVVSARHAALTLQEGVWWLTDLHSTNGTRLNDRPVETPTPVHPGDVISLGNIQLQLEEDA
ncbi:MAG: FHA domain-containing protein [Caldilineae bacterium]|nr:MAG: FHA domain-containing protein [Caldilineae bacterium]